MHTADRTTALKATELLDLQAVAAAVAARGRPVRALVQGESDFPTPLHIIQAGQAALAAGHTTYPPGAGYLDLCVAIADKLRRKNGIEADPETEVFVTNGGGLGVLLAVLAIAGPGDEVIVSDPTYGPFLDALAVAGARPRFVPRVRDATQWRWDTEALEAAVTHRTRAILFDTPAAPTGAVMRADELRAIGAFAMRHDIAIISDEVFEDILFDDARHISIAALEPVFAERTLCVYSFSKSYAMTGWRLGYLTGPATLIQKIEHMSLAFGRSSAAFVQRAGLAALHGPQNGVAAMRAEFARRRALVEDALRQIPSLRWITPEGAFYHFLDFTAHGRDSTALSRRLIEEAGVFLTPGTFYGPAGAGWLRLSFAGALDNTLAALEAVRETVARWDG